MLTHVTPPQPHQRIASPTTVRVEVDDWYAQLDFLEGKRPLVGWPSLQSPTQIETLPYALDVELDVARARAIIGRSADVQRQLDQDPEF